MNTQQDPGVWTDANGIMVPYPEQYPCMGYGPNNTVWACETAESRNMIGTHDGKTGKITYDTARQVAEQVTKENK